MTQRQGKMAAEGYPVQGADTNVDGGVGAGGSEYVQQPQYVNKGGFQGYNYPQQGQFGQGYGPGYANDDPQRKKRHRVANTFAAIFVACWACTWPCHGPCCCGL